MAKFGVFYGGNDAPSQTVEGERMIPRDAEYIDIVVGVGTERKVVGTFRLDKGQTVKELKEASAAGR